MENRCDCDLFRYQPQNGGHANSTYPAHARLEKLAVVDSLNETVKALALSGIRQRHPTASPEQIHRMLADLILGKELARRVYDHAR